MQYRIALLLKYFVVKKVQKKSYERLSLAQHLAHETYLIKGKFVMGVD